MKVEISQADVMTAFLQAVLDRGQKAVAGELGIQVSTLSNKVQPFDHDDRRHYLNLWEADHILGFTGDMRPLQLLAARHGFALMPVEAKPSEATLEAEKLQDWQAMAKYQAEKDPIKAVYAFNDLIRELLETDTARVITPSPESAA